MQCQIQLLVIIFYYPSKHNSNQLFTFGKYLQIFDLQAWEISSRRQIFSDISLINSFYRFNIIWVTLFSLSPVAFTISTLVFPLFKKYMLFIRFITHKKIGLTVTPIILHRWLTAKKEGTIISYLSGCLFALLHICFL